MLNSMKGAPRHVVTWWKRTGLEGALYARVEQGKTWEEAHLELVAEYQRWWDEGRQGTNPLLLQSNARYRAHVLEQVSKGHPHVFRMFGDELRVALTPNGGYVKA